MFIRCASIEAKRSLPDALCVALHPGTVNTQLSAPFTQRTPPERLFSPGQSARYLLDVIDGLTVEDTGRVFAWDGKTIEY